ncbi:hypothetical protein BD770DRAFT_423468 [Pilaira anomala]|nr:hypothetical protein BD770DRAFT_423468 [Pilaira anomala]
MYLILRGSLDVPTSSSSTIVAIVLRMEPSSSCLEIGLMRRRPTRTEAKALFESSNVECIPSPRKLRKVIRCHIGKTDDFDLMELYDVNFIETISLHYLNLMDSSLNPLLGQQLERTAAVNTTIIILNNLFIDVNDQIGFKWYEVHTSMTLNQKWDRVGFSMKDSKFTPILIEFSGGVEFNNTEIKEEHDFKKKIISGYGTTKLNVPIPEFVVRFYDSDIYFESIVKLGDDIYIRRKYAIVPVSTTVALLKTFLTKVEVMYQWREGVINLIKSARN